MQVSNYTQRNVGPKRAEDINLIILLSWDSLILYGSEADNITARHTKSTVIFLREKKISYLIFPRVSPEEIRLRG